MGRQRVNSKTTQLCLTLQLETLCKQSVSEWIIGAAGSHRQKLSSQEH